MSTEPVLCTVEDGVAVVTLNNPPLNLVTLEMTHHLHDVVARLADDPEVRALVLTDAGDKAFYAGSDIKEFPEMMAAGAVVPKKLALENETWSLVDHFPKPTIAGISGLAFGAGLELAVCCDLIVAEEGGKVALPEIRLRVLPAPHDPGDAAHRRGPGQGGDVLRDQLPVQPPSGSRRATFTAESEDGWSG